jgi:membrane-bound lytic murein transglycosylase B
MNSLAARLGRLLLAAGCSVAACPAAGCTVATGQHVPRPRTADGPLTKALARSLPSAARTTPAGAVPAIGGDPARLAAQLTAAEAGLDRGGVSSAALTRQALTVQMVCLRLAERPGWASAVIDRVAPAQRAAAVADITGTADMVALTPPAASLPRWRIVSPESLAALRADYRAAQAATGVGWSYLAAINFVETNFGRIAGLSSAGAEGPMQFLPATWAIYGRGDVHRARDAIFAAARLLASRGAPANISSAVYAYNRSWHYVDAVQRYARRLRGDPGALAGYYQRQVIYRLSRGWVMLPPGYGINPAVRAVPLGI